MRHVGMTLLGLLGGLLAGVVLQDVLAQALIADGKVTTLGLVLLPLLLPLSTLLGGGIALVLSLTRPRRNGR
ncbi:hypothetical protein ACT3SP_08445 [Brachybacterium sp. AOP43-C2-M15]|uniref:hypothetical protein n=1 Tax=Brachybacterium sp. AOP43-C2-M15 TaxID=3457661 RepID=UPI004033B833